MNVSHAPSPAKPEAATSRAWQDISDLYLQNLLHPALKESTSAEALQKRCTSSFGMGPISTKVFFTLHVLRTVRYRKRQQMSGLLAGILERQKALHGRPPHGLSESCFSRPQSSRSQPARSLLAAQQAASCNTCPKHGGIWYLETTYGRLAHS